MHSSMPSLCPGETTRSMYARAGGDESSSNAARTLGRCRIGGKWSRRTPLVILARPALINCNSSCLPNISLSELGISCGESRGLIVGVVGDRLVSPCRLKSLRLLRSSLLLPGCCCHSPWQILALKRAPTSDVSLVFAPPPATFVVPKHASTSTVLLVVAPPRTAVIFVVDHSG